MRDGVGAECGTQPVHEVTEVEVLELDEALVAQAHQVFHDHGSRVQAQILRYLKGRKETLDRWSRTFFTFQSAPMSLLWGVEDPVAVIAMADRVKKGRPYTDLYKLEGVAH